MGFFRQHERLRVPQFWKGDEQAFVAQLERILDTLFNLKVGENDIDPKFLSNLFTKKPVILDKNDDANTALASGLYYIRQQVSHSPVEWAGMIVINSGNQGRDIYQLIFNEKGLWVRDFSGAPPNTVWKEWRQYRGMYVPGQTVTLSYDCQLVGHGYVTDGGTGMCARFRLPMDVPSKTLTLSSLTMIARGTSGYVDIFDWAGVQTEKVGIQGYTYRAYGNNSDLGLLVNKSSALTNVTNNTPIAFTISSITFSIPY